MTGYLGMTLFITIALLLSITICQVSFSNTIPVLIIPDENLSVHNDMTYYPHYVKFHIIPEGENISVSIFTSDNIPKKTLKTDTNSDVVFEMISVNRYLVSVPERHIAVQIYPYDSEYILRGGKNH